MSDMVRVRIQRVYASGNRRGWTKLVYSVDRTKNDGFAFEGEFLDDHEFDLEVGSVLIQKNPTGTLQRPRNVGIALEVKEDGALEQIAGPYDWKAEFLTFRDHVADMIDEIAQEQPQREELTPPPTTSRRRGKVSPKTTSAEGEYDEAVNTIYSLMKRHGITLEDLRGLE